MLSTSRGLKIGAVTVPLRALVSLPGHVRWLRRVVLLKQALAAHPRGGTRESLRPSSRPASEPLSNGRSSRDDEAVPLTLALEP